MSTLKQKLEKFVYLKKRIAEAEAAISMDKSDLKDAETALLDAMLDEGMQQMKDASGAMVYLSKGFNAKVKDGMMPEAVEYLQKSGHASLVSVNHNSVRSFVKEQIALSGCKPEELTRDEAFNALPSELQEFIDLTEYTKLGARGIK
jgi:hypothetical protein